MKHIIVLILCLIFAASAVQAQNKLQVYADAGKHRINKNIYGHFAEHLGRCIYDGIWVGPESSIPNVRGYRKDVLEALQALEIPVLRWPGGCFADTYHWQDGIGPRNERPKIKNVFWGGVIEDNSFGTHEFLDLCELLGSDPYISANVGSGTVEEMIDWIVYMTSDEDVPMANLRRQHGREKPWNVKFIGIGNESWGCGGEMTPEHYTDLMRTFSSYARLYGPRTMTRVGSGANSEDYNWTKVLMQNGARFMDALSVHYYTIAGEGWHKKSSATDFGEELYFRGIRQGLKMDELVSRHSTIMDQYDRQKHVPLYVDEWGIWTDVEPGTNPGFLFQQNSLRDALIAATSLDILNKHCERVQMANIAQTVNVLQAMILTEGDKMVKTPTYHAFDLYKGHKGSLLLPSRLSAENYTFGNESIPAISGTVSLADDGSMFLTVSNVNPNKPLHLDVELFGKEFKEVTSARVLTAPAVNSINSFDRPETVKPAAFSAYKKTGARTLQIDLPAKALVSMRLK